MSDVANRVGLRPVDPPEPPDGGWELRYGGEAHEPVNGARYDVTSAIDGSIIASLPNADRDDLDAAVDAARDASREWGKSSPARRASALEKYVARLLDANERLGLLDTINAGMPIAATRMEARAASSITRLAHLATNIKGSTFPDAGGVWGYTTREPYGIVGSILPFNHPSVAAAHAIGEALAAGNAVILKPSEHTSLSALEMGRLAQDVLPAGLVSILTGDGPVIGNAIAEHPDIPRLTFTGSIKTGRSVLRAAAESIKHVTLELGGKGPLAVLPDVELDRAVDIAVGGMNFRGVQAGQSCQSTSRVLVHESMYERFAHRMVQVMAAIRIGDPRDYQTEMGALAFRSHFDRVRGYIQIGLEQGATLAGGGGIPEGLEGGYFVEPTVFTNVDRSMRIANEEIFGPVVALMRWSSEDELIDIANSVEYGLTARIACGNVGPGMKLARELEAGRMWINVANGGPMGMPFGGFKHSGIGKTGDFESLQSFTREKSISIAL